MNKWEESLTNKNDKRELLIESSEFVSKVKLSKGLKESLSMQSTKAGTLVVKNIPVTILDRENLNGRIYSTEMMRQAIEEAKPAMADKQTLGQANEHPEGSFVAPTDASHVIVNAYIKENISIVVNGKKERHNVLFTDWEVLNTSHGKDLRALFEAECSFGTSIRGVGELSGKMVQNYAFISVDGVGNPSSSTFTRMPVSESVKVELKDENELKENYTVSSSSTNVVRDLSQAGVLQQQLNANPYGTVTKTSTKVDQETDPKTGAQTSITTVEADTEDEVSDLNQAFQMAHKAMTNGISKVNSVTIEAHDDEDDRGNKTESLESNGLESYVPESTQLEEKQITGADDKESSIEFLSRLSDKAKYMFLSRMQMDCRYFLGNGNFYNKYLWAANPEEQIACMKYLYNAVPEKPEWISMEEIEGYEKQMVGKGKEFNYDESAITEAVKKKEEIADPNDGRQYVLKIKDNDSSMEEGADDAPEFVAMKGNAIRFTKDPKKALHFTQGMEESGIVHYSNIQKLLADMGYGDKDLEKWYKRDEVETAPKKQNVAVKPQVVEKESTQLTEDGNTKFSAILEIVNKGGLPETKSLSISATDMEAALKEVSNHWQQQQASNDVNRVVKLTLVDNETQQKYNYDPNNNTLVADKPEETQLESTDGTIEQDGNKLAIDVDDNTHVEKEFDTKAQADVAKAGIESGKLDGNVMMTEGGLDSNAVFKITNYDLDPEDLPAPYKTGQRNPYEEIGDEILVQIDMDTVEDLSILPDIIYMAARNKTDMPINGGQIRLVKESADGAMEIVESSKPIEVDLTKDRSKSLPYTLWFKCDKSTFDSLDKTFQDLFRKNIIWNWDASDEIPNTLFVSGLTQRDCNVLLNILRRIGNEFVSKGFVSGKKFESVEDDNAGLATGWYAAHDKAGICGPYSTREACMEGLEEYKDELDTYEVNTDDLTEVLFKNADEPSDAYVEKPLDEDYMEYREIAPSEGDKGGYSFRGKNYNLVAYKLNDGKYEICALDKSWNPVTNWHVVKVKDSDELFDVAKSTFEKLDGAMGVAAESVNESTLVPVRFSNIKWNEQDVAYRMFEDIEKDMQVSHIEPNTKSAGILAEYFESYMNELKNVSVNYKIDPSLISESADLTAQIIKVYNEDSSRQYPKIECADVNLG